MLTEEHCCYDNAIQADNDGAADPHGRFESFCTYTRRPNDMYFFDLAMVRKSVTEKSRALLRKKYVRSFDVA